MRINRTSFIAGAGSAVLLGAALVPALAGAQTATETPDTTGTATATATADSGSGESALDCGPGFGHGLAFGFGHGFGGFIHGGEDLADALGVTEEDLRAAAETARDSLGEVERPATEEEREALRQQYESAFAQALGVTVEELEAAIEEAQEAAKAAAIARVQELVADGAITQERADAIIERIESGEPVFPGRGPGGPGRGFDGGFGGGFDGGGRGGPAGLFGVRGTSSSTVTPDA